MLLKKYLHGGLIITCFTLCVHGMGEEAGTVKSLKHLSMDCLWNQEKALESDGSIPEELVEEFRNYKETQLLKAVRSSNLSELEQNLLVNIFDIDYRKKNSAFFHYVYFKCKYLFEMKHNNSCKNIINVLQKFMSESTINYFSSENKCSQRFIASLFTGEIEIIKALLRDSQTDINNRLIALGIWISAAQGYRSLMLMLYDALQTRFIDSGIGSAERRFSLLILPLQASLDLAITYNKKNIIKLVMSLTELQAENPENLKMFYEALCTSIRSGNRKITKILCNTYNKLIAIKRKHPEGIFDLIGLAEALGNAELSQLLNERLEEIAAKSEQHEVKSLKQCIMDSLYNRGQSLLSEVIPVELIKEFNSYRDIWKSEVMLTNSSFSKLEQDSLKSLTDNSKKSPFKQKRSLYFRYLYTKCKYLALSQDLQVYRELVESLEQAHPECLINYFSPGNELKQEFLSALFNDKDGDRKALKLLKNEEIKNDAELIGIGLIIAVSTNKWVFASRFFDYLRSMCRAEKITNLMLEDVVSASLSVAIGYDRVSMARLFIRSYPYPTQISAGIFYKNLIRCIRYQNVSIARSILQIYRLRSAVNYSNVNFLATAASFGNLGMVRLLLSKGANVYESQDQLRCANLLFSAIEGENLALVKFFVENYDMTKKLNEALCQAVSRGKLAIVKYLVEQGATIDAFKDSKHLMALALAGAYLRKPVGNLDNYTSSSGLERSVINEANFIVASCQGNVETLSYLINKEGITDNTFLNQALRSAFWADQEEVIEYLIDLGVRFEVNAIKSVSEMERSFLLAALSRSKNAKMFQRVLVLGEYPQEYIEMLLRANDLYMVPIQNVKCLVEHLQSPSSNLINEIFRNGIRQGNIPLIEHFLNDKFETIAWAFDDSNLTQNIAQADAFGQAELKNYLVEYQKEKRRQTRVAAIEKRLQNNKESN